MPRLPTVLPTAGSNPTISIEWLGDDRSYQQLRQATRLYQDPDWRKQNHFTKTKATAFLQKRYPQLRACPLTLDQLGELFEIFPERADWAVRDFDPRRLWDDLNDPEQQRARRQAARAKREELLEESRQFVADTLKDRLLLAIRGGAWHRVTDLVSVVEQFAPVGLAARRFIASDGTGHPATVQEARGSYLLLDEAVALCCREKLAEIRTNGELNEIRSTPRQDERFEVCPRFRDLLPRSPDEVARLEALLLNDGCRDPLVVWESKGWLIDGHTRYSFCSLLGRDYSVVYRQFDSEKEACAYVQDLHYGRRSFSLLQKSLVRARRYLALKGQRGGYRPRKAESKSKNSTKRGTAEIVAQEYGVDRQTIYNDVHLAEAIDLIVATCGEQVLSFLLVGGKKRPKKGYLVRLSRLDEAAQKQVLAEAMAQDRWPKIPGPGQRKVKLVGLPVGKPKAQARLLRRRLGKQGIARLMKALHDLTEAEERTNRGNHAEPQPVREALA